MATTEEKLKTFLQDIAKKENYTSGQIDIKPISSEGANYTTDLFLATISEPLKPDINIFAKAANLGEDLRQNNEFLTTVYEIEALFYTELVVNFERLYNKHQVPAKDRLVIPKYYGQVLIPYEEILVLENLEAIGFKNFDRMKTFNWEYAATGVTQLAKFHALGLAYREENPDKFEKIVSRFTFAIPNYQTLVEQLIQTTLEYGCEGLNSDDKKRLLNYFSSKENFTTSMTNILQDRTMLVHGDFRPSNLMHRRRNGKLEIILLDYQTLRMGNPVADLMHFLFVGSDEEFRRLHFKRLLEHYFSQLTRALQQLNVDVEKVYPRKTFDADIIEVRLLGLFDALAFLSILTMAPEDAPKVDEDIRNIQIKPNQLAQERIAGVVRDFIRWGVL